MTDRRRGRPSNRRRRGRGGRTNQNENQNQSQPRRSQPRQRHRQSPAGARAHPSESRSRRQRPHNRDNNHRGHRSQRRRAGRRHHQQSQRESENQSAVSVSVSEELHYDDNTTNNNNNNNSDAYHNQSSTGTGISNTSDHNNGADAISANVLCLTEMNPSLNLSLAEAKHIYVSICEENMQRAIQYVLDLTHNHDHDNNHNNNNNDEGKQEQEPEPEPEPGQNHTLATTNFKPNSFSISSDAEAMAMIKRIGDALFEYHTRRESNSTYYLSNKIQAQTVQTMNDYILIHRKAMEAKNSSENIFEFVEEWLKMKYFHGQYECRLDACECMARNTRDRLNEERAFANETYFDFVLSSMHCSLLHAFDTGYRLTRQELKMVADAQQQQEEEDNEDNEEKEEDENEEMHNESAMDDLFDRSAYLVRDMLGGRRNAYQHLRNDCHNAGSDSNSASHTNTNTNTNASKFVTVFDDDDNNHNNNNNDDDGNNELAVAVAVAKAQISYNFGMKFYYWAYFKNNLSNDVFHNGRRYRYCDWWIATKFETLKDELLRNALRTITLSAWTKEAQKIERVWMDTEYVQAMKAYYGHDYNVETDAVVTLPHLLALALYTNFTSLCTAFSRVFRRIPESESDASLKARNSNFREWARHLIECIHCWGTRVDYSDIEVFFHGISIPMVFNAMYAVFCSPTSTTNSMGVAMNFAKTGMILELLNNRSNSLKYFDCVMSDFNSEQELLFMNAGYARTYCQLEYTSLPFRTIRSLESNMNYGKYVTAIATLQTILNGKMFQTSNQLRSKKKNVKALARLIANATSASASASVTNPHMAYIQSVFAKCMQTMKQIKIFVPLLNLETLSGPPLFLLYRAVLCELYSDEVLRANAEQWKITNEKHPYHPPSDGVFVNPIKSVKIRLLLRLCPNVVNFEIVQLPITHYVMDLVLDIARETAANVNQHKIGRFFIGVQGSFEDESAPDFACYPASQSSFESYAVCATQYREQFAEHGWSIIERTKENQYIDQIGLEIVSETFDQSFFLDVDTSACVIL